MGIRLNAAAVEGIQTLLDWGTMGGWPDDRLIDQLRCAQGAREAAFRALIHRHGPLVMGICRRVLGDEHAAEDAFQATFVVLLKKAGTLRHVDLLSNWLHGVALRTATKEKVKAARRRVVEWQAAGEARGEPDHPERSELRTVIDEEIRRLPERYRVPVVLHYLEGLRLEVIASRLGCPVGTVRSRLSRARDRLQSRLTRRGLSPTASALGQLARPLGTSDLPRRLVEATAQTGLRGGAGRALAWSLLKPGLGLVTPLRAGVLASVLLIGSGLGALAWRVDRTAVGPGTPGAMVGDPGRLASQDRSSAPPTRAVTGPPDERGGSPVPSRSSSAVASPLARITIDGRLDDWPGRLRHYPIGNQFGVGRLDNMAYDTRRREALHDPDGYFMVGYDAGAGLIYVAVVVRDDENTLIDDVNRTDDRVCLDTDAVEIFVDGAFSDRKIERKEGEGLADRRARLDAARMPVLQYVGVPGPTPAYGDPSGANPALVYGRIERTRTVMRYRREGDVTTYEWAVQAFDQYPDRPARLHPGARLGFDVAIVDKDRTGRPAYLTWGPVPPYFKGYDAGTLGELILADGPPEAVEGSSP
jgi:RNA polymerase sigma factor (sigma-70 family)